MATFTNQMRFTGMSGLDVNDMVSQIMRGHSVRLDRMRQGRDVMRWQTDLLRGVAGSLRTFRDSRLSFTSNQKQNIRAPGNFNAVTSKVINSETGEAARGVNVTLAEGGRAGTRNLRVDSVARGDTFRSVNSLNQSIRATSTFDHVGAMGGVSLGVSLNGRRVSIDAAENVARNFTSGRNFLDWFNGELRREFGVDNAGPLNPGFTMGPDPSQTIVNPALNMVHNPAAGRYEFTNQTSVTMIIDDVERTFTAGGTGYDGLFVRNPNFGVTNHPTATQQFISAEGQTGNHLYRMNPAWGEWQADPNRDMTNIPPSHIRLDHVSVRIQDPDAEHVPIPGTGNSAGAERQHVWASLENNRLVIHARDGNTVTLSDGNNREVWSSRPDMFGFEVARGAGGERINPSTTVNPNTMTMANLLGSRDGAFNFEINGNTFAFNGRNLTVNGTTVRNVVNAENLTMQHVMDAVNASDAGVRMSFNATSGRVSLESLSTGAAAGAVRFRDNSGGFFSRIGFGESHDTTGIRSGANMNNEPNTPITASFDWNNLAALEELFGGGFNFRMTMNGSFGTSINVPAFEDLVNSVLNDVNFTTPLTGTATENQQTIFMHWLNRELGSTFGTATLPEATPPNPPVIQPGHSVANWGNAANVPSGVVDSRQHVWATMDDDGNISFRTRTENDITIMDGTGANGVRLGQLGINNVHMAGNVAIAHSRFHPASTSLGQLGITDTRVIINGYTFDGFTTNTSVREVMNTINNSNAGVTMTFDAGSGRFSIVSNDPNADYSDIRLGGDDGSGMNFFNRIGLGHERVNMPSARAHAASDAVILVDGERFVRATNNFEVDGLNINLDPNALTGLENGPINMQITFDRDTAPIMQMIQDFIEEYNSLVRSIRDLTETRRPRQSGGGGFFMPLSDEQRREMTEREVELWEEQARTGLLNRDDTLRRLTSSLHSAMFMNVPLSGGGTINLLDVGIRTHQDLTRFGELQIDEERLQYFLDNRLDDVKELFTNASDKPGMGNNADRPGRLRESGLGMRIADIIQWELSHGGGLHGRVGATSGEGAPLENNEMQRRMNTEDRRIDNMLRNLERREQRYFMMFGRLEAAMIQSNSQMMFMEQLFWM